MVDDDILLADRGKAITIMLADPFGEARRIGRELELGPIAVDQLGEVR